MHSPSSLSISSSTLILTLLAFSPLATASLSLQALQAIANFPPNCEAAYQIPIQSCPDSSAFSLSLSGSNNGPSVCTQDCFNAITRATINIQKACQGTAAPPGTVIAHAFAGDLPKFLCIPGSGSGSQPSSNPDTSTTAPQTSSAASSGPTGGDISSNASAPSSTSDTQASPTVSTNLSSSTSTSTSSPSTTSSSEFKSTSASSTSRLSQSSSRSTASSSSTLTRATSSSSSKPEPTLNHDGSGSPFDQVLPNRAASVIDYPSILPLLVSSVIAIVLGS